MHLSRLLVENFRSYLKKDFTFSPQINLILGHNGSGKTNLLESIYFLSSGKSFRASALSQMILWNQPFLSVSGTLGPSGSQLEAQLIRQENSSSISRRFYVDHVLKPRSKYLSTFRVVIFEPEDIRLITGSPSRRRDYLDNIFQISEWRYAQSLSQYNKALKHRNELLDLIRQNLATKAELFYWDQSLIKNADIIEKYRLSFTASVNLFFKEHSHPEIQQLHFQLKTSPLSQSILEQNYPHELSQGYTLAGPHRDDFSLLSHLFPTTDPSLAFWGSRGQQRLAVLALRLAQLNYFENLYQQPPILLLDDIFSELDPEHRYLVTEICQKYQTIFTSAEPETISLLPNSTIFNLPTAQN